MENCDCREDDCAVLLKKMQKNIVNVEKKYFLYISVFKLAEISEDLGGAMSGISVDSLEDEEKLAVRGW